MLPDGTTPLPEPMLTCYEKCSMALTWGYFHGKYSRYLSFKYVWQLLIYHHRHRDRWGNHRLCSFRYNFIAWWRHQMETFSASLAFVRGIHQSPVNSPHKGQWRGALMFSPICAWMNGWVYNPEAGDLTRHCAHYDVIVMKYRDTLWVLAPTFWWGLGRGTA